MTVSQTATAPPPPPLSALAEDLYDALAPMQYAEADAGYALARYLAALALLLDPVAEISRTDPATDDEGWTAAADPDRCPPWLLRWLAMWAGIHVPRDQDEGQTRYLIGHAPNQIRGTRQAMEAAARNTLTGTQRLWFQERDGGAYQLTVYTWVSETPDPDTTRRAIFAAKPAGIILTYETRVGQFYEDVFGRHADYAEVRASYSTYDAMLHEAPPN